MAKTTDEKLDMLLEGMAFMRQELTEVKNDVSSLKSDVSSLKQDVADIKNEQSDMNKRLTRVEETVTRIENVHGDKLAALFDGHSQNKEQLEKISHKIDDLSDKVDKHDIKIQVIEGGKYKAQ